MENVNRHPPGSRKPCPEVLPPPPREIETIIRTVPTYAVPYLVDQDASGLSEEEIEQLDQFRTTLEGWWPVCPEGEPFFCPSNDVTRFADDCMLLTFVRLPERKHSF